ITGLMLFSPSLKSIINIGDEGFFKYDSANPFSYTAPLWDVNDLEARHVHGSISAFTLVGRPDVLSGIGECYTASKIPPSCKEIQVGTSCSYQCEGYAFQTKNLYLVNAKIELDMIVDEGEHELFICGGGVIKVGEVNIDLGTEAQHLRDAECQNKEYSIELRWNNYELGKYDVFKNNIYFGSGTAKEDELIIQFLPENAGQDQQASNIKIKRFIVKELFGCDPTDSEVIKFACYKGKTTLTRDELPEWKEGISRFCLELPATHLVDGIATGSDRVYYDLAAEGIDIAENEAYEFKYITPAVFGDDTGIVGNCDVRVEN
ncbi:hypothetical protein GOV10_05945, partial [Candidatus Woesearchaeota archaeon]|nr:hypothetical protein [Candidatus Woesearchaeota archaeon]